jgi:hypothetical protein
MRAHVNAVARRFAPLEDKIEMSRHEDPVRVKAMTERSLALVPLAPMPLAFVPCSCCLHAYMPAPLSYLRVITCTYVP